MEDADDEDIIPPVKEYEIKMEDTEDEVEVIIPVKKYKINDQILGVRTCRKVAKRTRPSFLPTVAENHTLTPLEEEDLPVAKRQRRQAPASISTAADGVVHHVHTADTATTDSADDTPTDPVSPAALLPSATTSRAPPRPWTPAEDAKLTDAVKRYSNNWVAVAKLVPGRTHRQCRRRWVDTLNISNKKKGKWPPAEDVKLMEAVKKYGKDWVAVAKLVPGRTNVQCHRRWVDTLTFSDGKKGKWTPAEVSNLKEAVKKCGKDWATVAKLVPGRTNEQCRSRWVAILDVSNGKKGEWTPAEDAKLTKAVNKHGNNWVTVATLVPGRTNMQCRQHWVHTLDRTNTGKEGKWTPAEDAKLTKAVKKYGKDWVAVATLVPGRTNLQCLRRWVGPLNLSNGKKGTWTQEEDAKLTDAVKKHGKDWVAVAKLVPGRTNLRCRSRWVDTLNISNGKKGKWSPAEDAKLAEAVKKHGNN
jgi:hypothetical protein